MLADKTITPYSKTPFDSLSDVAYSAFWKNALYLETYNILRDLKLTCSCKATLPSAEALLDLIAKRESERVCLTSHTKKIKTTFEHYLTVHSRLRREAHLLTETEAAGDLLLIERELAALIVLETERRIALDSIDESFLIWKTARATDHEDWGNHYCQNMEFLETYKKQPDKLDSEIITEEADTALAFDFFEAHKVLRQCRDMIIDR